MENFVACLRLSRSLILSCICPLPFLSISFNSVKRDSFLLWLPFSVHFCVGGLLGVHEAFCDVAMRNASLPGSCTVSFLFARSHAHFISLVLSYVRGQDQPYPPPPTADIPTRTIHSPSAPSRHFSTLPYPTLLFPSTQPQRQRVCLCSVQCRIYYFNLLVCTFLKKQISLLSKNKLNFIKIWKQIDFINI